MTGITSGAPPSVGGLTLIRTTATATVSRYRAGKSGIDHEWKIGAQVERGEAHGPNLIPTGVRYDDQNGAPFRSIASDPSHSGGMFVTAAGFAGDGYTRVRSVVSSSNLLIDSHMRPPHSDEYSIGVDREFTRALSMAVAYVRKQGADFIGWTDVGGTYDQVPRTLADGRTVRAFELTNSTTDRRLLLTNRTVTMLFHGPGQS